MCNLTEYIHLMGTVVEYGCLTRNSLRYFFYNADCIQYFLKQFVKFGCKQDEVWLFWSI